MNRPKETKTVIKQTVEWVAKGKDGKPRRIPIVELEDNHLQRNLWSVQKRYSELSDKIESLLMLEEILEKEAERRGISLSDYDPSKAKKPKQKKEA